MYDIREGMVKSGMADYNKAEIMQIVEDEDVEFIRLQFTDMQGILKNIAIPAGRLSNALEGKCAVDLASVEGFSRGETEELYLKPDLNTFTILPWRPQQGKVARLLCDICNADGTEYEDSSRYVLKRVMEHVGKMGYSLQVSPECEFFLFHTDDTGHPTTLSHEQATYLDTSPVDLGENTRRDIILAMEDMGYEIDSSHHEIAPAQHEIDFTYDDALATADKIMTFKVATRTIARRYGLHATFMPKPRAGVNGSGMHLNLRLIKDGQNVLMDEKGELSEEGRAFLAGILYHIPGMTAVLNPLVNSYKRLVPGFEAPWELSWSANQRNALIRVRKRKGDTLDMELRSPDGASNPYLVFALCLAAGVDGITKKMKVQEEQREDVHRLSEDERMDKELTVLPENLGEALSAMKNDSLVCDTLGGNFSKKYLRAKRKEWNGYLAQVSDWELEQYLYMI